MPDNMTDVLNVKKASFEDEPQVEDDYDVSITLKSFENTSVP